MALAEITETDRDPVTREINKFLNETWRGQNVSLDTLLPIIMVHKEGVRSRNVFPLIIDSNFVSPARASFFRGYSVGSLKAGARTIFERDSIGIKISVEEDLPEWKFNRANEKGIVLLNKEAGMWDKMMGHWENPSKYVQHIYDCGTARDRISNAKKALFVITFAPSSEIRVDTKSRIYAGQWLMGAIKHGYAKPAGVPPSGEAVVKT